MNALALLLLLGQAATADEGICTSAEPSNSPAMDIAIVTALLNWMPPEKDVVDPNGYDHGRGDNDGDGTINSRDAFPNDARDTRDSDKDGVGDKTDAFPKDKKETRDSDCDGEGDNSDDKFDGLGRVSTTKYYSGDGVYGQNVAFKMVNTPDGTMHAIVKVKLTGSRNAARESRWESEVEDFWSNDSFKLDIQWVSSGQDNTVNVRRGSGRANSGTFYASTDSLTVAHEMGHLLGLNDEYDDSNDPYRLIGEANSIMRVTWSKPKPYTRHLATMRSHFDCSRSRPATEADIAALRKDPEKKPTTETPRNEVQPPEGTSKYIASGDAYADSFVKKDGENTYMTHARDTWWTWNSTVDGTHLQVTHPTTGEQVVLETSELSVVVKPGG